MHLRGASWQHTVQPGLYLRRSSSTRLVDSDVPHNEAAPDDVWRLQEKYAAFGQARSAEGEARKAEPEESSPTVDLATLRDEMMSLPELTQAVANGSLTEAGKSFMAALLDPEFATRMGEFGQFHLPLVTCI